MLVSARHRPAAVAVAAAGAVSAAALGAVVHHGTGTAFDRWAFFRVVRHVGPNSALLLYDLSSPMLSVAVVGAVVVIALVARRRDVLLLALIGPAAAVLVSEVVVKPLVGRYIGPHVLTGDLTGARQGAFPSGHETAVVAAAVAVFLAALTTRPRPPATLGIAAALLAWCFFAAVGLVRNYLHYPTDTVGAAGVAVAVVTATALLVDRVIRVS